MPPATSTLSMAHISSISRRDAPYPPSLTSLSPSSVLLPTGLGAWASGNRRGQSDTQSSTQSSAHAQLQLAAAKPSGAPVALAPRPPSSFSWRPSPSSTSESPSPPPPSSSSSVASAATATATAAMSFMFNTSFPKSRSEQQQQQQQQAQPQPQPSSQPAPSHMSQHPAPNAFDPNSIYTTGALFADAFRTTSAAQSQGHSQSQDPFRRFDHNPSSSLDIHDELSFLSPTSSSNHPSSLANRSSLSGQAHTPQPAASANDHPPSSYQVPADAFPRGHDIFGVNQPHLTSFSLPHNRSLFSRDSGDFSTTPASLHNSYGRSDFFNPAQVAADQRHHHHHHHSEQQLTPQQQQQQQQFGLLTRPLSSAGDPTALRSPLVDSFQPGGPQSPAAGPTRSRSRSRSKVSTSRTRVSKRPSLPPPDEPSGSSRGTSASRPAAIVIPGQNPHSFASFGQQSPASWFVPPSDPFSVPQSAGPVDGNANAGGSGGGGGHMYSQSFGGGSLTMGASPSTQNGGSPPNPGDTEAASKLALANEKRRKRRESHNAVERRRRDNINEKIQELAMLLPDEWLEGTGKAMAGLMSGTVAGSIGDDEPKEIKANKGVILRNSVEYIKNLVQLVQVQRTRNQQLESELSQYRTRFGNAVEGSSQGNTNGVAFDGLGGVHLDGSGNANGVSTGDVNGGMNSSEEDAIMSNMLLSPGDYDLKNMFGLNPAGSDSLTHVLGQPGTNGVPMPIGMVVDGQSPSTGSGEGEEDDDLPRGRGRDRGSRFPSGAKKEEVIPSLS